jgi:hypothetical protein
MPATHHAAPCAPKWAELAGTGHFPIGRFVPNPLQPLWRLARPVEAVGPPRDYPWHELGQIPMSAFRPVALFPSAPTLTLIRNPKGGLSFRGITVAGIVLKSETTIIQLGFDSIARGVFGQHRQRTI